MLDRDRYVLGHRIDHHANNVLRQLGLTHQRRPAGAGHHSLGRTSHIDIDQGGADIDGHPRRRGQSLVFAAVNLYSEARAVQARSQLAHGFGVTLLQSVGRQKLCNREADPELFADGSKGQIGHRRHRRQEHRSVNGKRTDPHGKGRDERYKIALDRSALRAPHRARPGLSAPGKTIVIS